MKEFTQLVSAWLDGDISDAEIEQLHGHLHQSEANVRCFAEQINLNYLLRKAHAVDSSRSLAAAVQLRAAADVGATTGGSSGGFGERTAHEIAGRPASLLELDAVDMPLRRSGRLARTTVRQVVACAVSAAMVLAGVFAWTLSNPAVELIGGVGAQFVGTDAKPGSDLVGKTLELSQGFVELLFRQSDATLVIEAPAQFRVEDGETLRLDSGRVTAHVRDGKQGLRVLTPEADVFDLGTRFAVDATRGRRSEVHVFEGKVEAGVARSGSRQLLTANEALRFEGAAGPDRCDLRNGTFVQPEEVVPLAAALTAGQAGHAAQAAELLKRDPALLAFVDFEQAAASEPVEPAPEIVGARRVQGRFPGNVAVEFVDPADHVKLNLGVRPRQFTLLTWVRLNQDLRFCNSLYSADGWNARGQVHWMVEHNDRRQMDGLMRFTINGAPVEDERRRGESRWVHARGSLSGEFGRWVHLAVAYDADEQMARLYINGLCDSETRVPESIPALLGPAQIGNWMPEGDQPFRRLSGRIDEFVALSRVLTAAEISSYFHETTPYR